MIILLLFLHHARITAISASSIPLTLAISVFAMYLIGQTFNLMTLGAMAIAIGLVIDDSVVITENIVRHLRLNPNRHEAIREAVQELIWPVTTSTLTTVVVFLPLRLLKGVVGQFFAALSITLTIAVLVSLVLALTIIPLMSDQFLTAKDADVEGSDREPSNSKSANAGILDRLRHQLDIDFVEGLPILGVFEEYGRLGDVGERRAGGLEDGGDIADAAPRLVLDVAHLAGLD